LFAPVRIHAQPEAICIAKQISTDWHFTPLADLTGKAMRFLAKYEWEVVKVLDRKVALYTQTLSGS
jgi:hypothetical protein